jgi:hypothetical protein
MSSAFRVPVAKIVAVCSGILGLILLGGCHGDDYLARRDGVTFGLGEAVAANQATQVINPWPHYAKDTNFKTDGERIKLGVERYQKNESIEPKGLTEQKSGKSGVGLSQ